MKTHINYNTKKRFINIASLFLIFALFIGMMPADVFDASAASPGVYYRVHQQNYGTLSYVKNGQSAGYTDKSLRIESMSAYISGMSGSILYRTHQANIGWHGWSSNGSTSGREGQSLRLEAIQVKLTGEISKHYDVHYRVHMKSKGWGSWVKNGATAGTIGESRRLESIQIKLVAKAKTSTSSSSSKTSGTASKTSTSSLKDANLSTGFYKVLVPGTRFSWNIQFAPTSGNGNAVLDTFNNEGNEIVHIESLGNNKYYIRPYYRYSEGDFAYNSLYGKSTKENQQLIAHDATNRNDTASQWYIYKSGSNYVFKNVASGKYVTLAGMTITGAKLVLQSGHTSMGQIFAVEAVNVIPPANKTTFTISTNTSDTAGKLMFPLKRSITRSSSVTTNGYYCDYKTGGSIPVYAPADGTAVFKQTYHDGKLVSYGNRIDFTSSDGVYSVRMAHLDSFNGVSLIVSSSQTKKKSASDVSGEITKVLATRTVRQGELLGYTGKTGNASGHHLHIELYKNGKAQNPMAVFTAW